MITQDKWVWYGTPGHYVCANACQFHLCTKVGKFLISTIGEKVSSESIRKILGISGGAYEEVGCGRLYETMVFRWKGVCTSLPCNCRLPNIIPNEIDFAPANQRGVAAKNHLKICLKYAGMQ